MAKNRSIGSGRTAVSSLLFDEKNRGLLLDTVVFLANLFVMRMLLGVFLDLIRAASEGDPLAQFVLFGMCVAMFTLPPAGAVLKRWHFHQRREASGKEFMGGCLFNPIMYFCLMALVFSTINAFLMQFFFGNRDPGGGVFVSSILIGLVLMIAHTWLVYRYFSPLRSPPSSAFLLDRRSEVLGDVCIFVNMILFQLVWNLVTLFPPGPHPGFGEAIFRLFFLVFAALLVYFPPRIFYLAEDIGKRRTWLTILLANSPVIIRVVAGGFYPAPQ
jgi:hypothetical protein